MSVQTCLHTEADYLYAAPEKQALAVVGAGVGPVQSSCNTAALATRTVLLLYAHQLR